MSSDNAYWLIISTIKIVVAMLSMWLLNYHVSKQVFREWQKDNPDKIHHTRYYYTQIEWRDYHQRLGDRIYLIYGVPIVILIILSASL